MRIQSQEKLWNEIEKFKEMRPLEEYDVKEIK